MKSSTLKRIGRIAVASIVIFVWQFISVPFASHLWYGIRFAGYDGEPNYFDLGSLYDFRWVRQSSEIPFEVFGMQFFGLVALAVAVMALCLVYWACLAIWYGISEENPECNDPHCPCTWHQGEVFDPESETWKIPNCTNPRCTCVNRHDDEVFDKRTQQWVDA